MFLSNSESLFEFLSVSLSIKVPHEIKTSMKNFNDFSFPIALLVFSCSQWRQGILCVIQSLPHPDFGCVTRFAEWFCVRPSFLFSPSLLPNLKSPLPWPLRKAWYSGYFRLIFLLTRTHWFWRGTHAFAPGLTITISDKITGMQNGYTLSNKNGI